MRGRRAGAGGRGAPGPAAEGRPAAGRRRRGRGRGGERELGLRKWKEEGYDGSRMRNVRFTPGENEALLAAYRNWLTERGLDFEAHREKLMHEKQTKRAKTFNRIAAIANLKNRSVQSCANRLRRVLFGSIVWTEEKTCMLTRLVMEHLQQGQVKLEAGALGGAKSGGAAQGIKDEEEDEEALQDTKRVAKAVPTSTCYVGDEPAQVRVGWKAIAEVIGCSQEQARDKWFNVCGSGKKGRWNKQETLTLRKAIVEVTGHMSPSGEVPWKEVQRHVPHRSSKQCMDYYYSQIAPQVLQYVSLYGVPVEDEVWDRIIIRNMIKRKEDTLGLVSWSEVNKYLTAPMNRARFEFVRVRLPPDLAGKELDEQLPWLYKALECEENKKFDRKLLKFAELSEEFRARLLEMEERDAEAEAERERAVKAEPAVEADREPSSEDDLRPAVRSRKRRGELEPDAGKRRRKAGRRAAA